MTHLEEYLLNRVEALEQEIKYKNIEISCLRGAIPKSGEIVRCANCVHRIYKFKNIPFCDVWHCVTSEDTYCSNGKERDE